MPDELFKECAPTQELKQCRELLEKFRETVRTSVAATKVAKACGMTREDFTALERQTCIGHIRKTRPAAPELWRWHAAGVAFKPGCNTSYADCSLALPAELQPVHVIELRNELATLMDLPQGSLPVILSLTKLRRAP